LVFQQELAAFQAFEHELVDTRLGRKPAHDFVEVAVFDLHRPQAAQERPGIFYLHAPLHLEWLEWRPILRVRREHKTTVPVRARRAVAAQVRDAAHICAEFLGKAVGYKFQSRFPNVATGVRRGAATGDDSHEHF
jgi:hypothetical protein